MVLLNRGQKSMILIVLSMTEFQIRGVRDDIAKRLIQVFIFGIIKLSLLCLVRYLCSVYWNVVWKLFGMISLFTLNMKFRNWYKLSLYTLKMSFSSMKFLVLVICWLSYLGIAFTVCLCWLAIFLSFDLVVLAQAILP